MLRNTATVSDGTTMSMAGTDWNSHMNEGRKLDTDLQDHGMQGGSSSRSETDRRDYTMATSQESNHNEPGSNDDDEDEEDDKHRGLPVLTLQMADPIGSCFHELLYWVSAMNEFLCSNRALYCSEQNIVSNARCAYLQ